MARLPGSEGGGSSGGGSKGKAPKPPKAKKPPKGRKGRAPKAKKPHIPKPGTFHETAGAGSAGKSAGAAPAAGHAAGSGMAAHELHAATGLGVSGILLELVGEGTITLSAALSAWTRDQERVTNRAWRRPGGLARMGGL
jgi:hypothetical protein